MRTPARSPPFQETRAAARRALAGYGATVTATDHRSDAATTPPGDGAHRRLIYACFAASGTAGLVLQIVWSKYLSLLSGNSIHGVSTVVAAFLGGLGIGAWIGGRMAERAREPLVTYARLEAAVAVLALASQWRSSRRSR